MLNRIKVAGFTVAEMLTVLVIIAILAALLVPAAGILRERARAAGCAGNLRQIGSLVALFAGDNNNQLPSWQSLRASGATFADDKLWFHYLLPYLREGTWRISGTFWSSTENPEGHGVDLFKCPSQKDRFVLNYRVRYGINPTHASRLSEYPTIPPTILTRAHLREASKALLVADSMDRESNGALSEPLPDSARGFYIINALSQPISDRHMGGSNLLFADGHVEHRLFTEVITHPSDPAEVKTEKAKIWDQRVK